MVMKRFMVFSLMLLITICTNLNAQEHLMFMKTPMDGTIAEFSTKMKTKGFVLIGTDGGRAAMKGSFMGQDCTIAIGSTTKSSSVYVVNVLFLREYESDEWYNIKADYRRIVSAFRGKYGTPTDELEKFIYPYEEGDGMEIEALYRRKCWYFSRWKRPEGRIMVSMVNNRICINYEDKKNALLEQEEYQSDVNEDI